MTDTIRWLPILALLALVGCADRSQGAALSECRLMYYLESPARQRERIPDCMEAKSFQMLATCNPAVDPYEWDRQVTTFPYDNPKCYRPIGSTAWIATQLSPM